MKIPTNLTSFEESMLEQAVLVKIKLSSNSMGNDSEKKVILALESRLTDVVDKSGLGEFDGDDFGEGFCTLYIYGKSADRLFDAVIPILKTSPIPPNSHVVKRYGSPGAREEIVKL